MLSDEVRFNELGDKNFKKETDDDEWEIDEALTDLANKISFPYRFKRCPLCGESMFCLEFTGSSSRYLCTNLHILSINEGILAT